MKNQKLTPGKWQSAESMSGKLLIVAETEPGFQQTIAELKSKSVNIRADAMLLRSAPELLDLLIAATKRLVELGEGESNDLLLPRIDFLLNNLAGKINQEMGTDEPEDVGRNGWKIDGRGDE